MKTFAACLVIGCVFAAPAFSQDHSRRFALVIGNGAYAELGVLDNPVNDAADMDKALRGLGFETELLTDASLDAMEDAVVRLGDKLAGTDSGIGFFYYAGHGIQSGGVNYLIPADARIPSESFLKTKALAAQTVMDSIQTSRNALSVVVLDACRDNPFGWSRSGSRGLTVVAAQPEGSIVVYATSAGSVAQDGEGRNGVFTQELLKHLRTPGLDIKDVFNRTGAGVRDATGGKQVPAVYSQFFDSIALKEADGGSEAAKAKDPFPTVPAAASLNAAGSLSIDAYGKIIRMSLDGIERSSREDGNGALIFEGLPAGIPLTVQLSTARADKDLTLAGLIIPENGSMKVVSSEYRSWLAGALAAERSAIAKSVGGKRRAKIAGISLLAAGAAGAAAAGLTFYLGSEAGKAYDGAADTSGAEAARLRVELFRTLFGVSTGIGGTGLAAGAVLAASAAGTAGLEKSLAELDSRIDELGR
jgi:hypothetical protein